MIESCQSYSDRSFTDRRASGVSEIKYGISNSLFNRGASAGSKFWFRKKGVALHSWNLCYGISNSLFNGEVSTGSKSDSKKRELLYSTGIYDMLFPFLFVLCGGKACFLHSGSGLFVPSRTTWLYFPCGGNSLVISLHRIPQPPRKKRLCFPISTWAEYRIRRKSQNFCVRRIFEAVLASRCGLILSCRF